MDNSKTGGAAILDSASIASPNRKPATSSVPRMLTPSEIESLRRHKGEIGALAKAAFRRSPIAGKR